MVTKEYSIALAEVNYILKYSTSDVWKKVPYKFRKYIVQNMDKNHRCIIDLATPLEEQHISNDAKTLLALIYRDYIVSPSDRQILINNELSEKRKYEEHLKQLYNPDNIFKSKKDIPTTPSADLPIIKNKTLLDKFFDLLNNFLKK